MNIMETAGHDKEKKIRRKRAALAYAGLLGIGLRVGVVDVNEECWFGVEQFGEIDGFRGHTEMAHG